MLIILTHFYSLISVWCYERPADFCGKVYTHQERQRHCGTEGYGSTFKNELFEAIEGPHSKMDITALSGRSI